jgi:hypothetical protein
MSDHFDLADFQAPDPSTAAVDITGLYVFEAPADPARSVLILAVNPFGLAAAFEPGAIYRIDVDSDGNFLADLAFSVVFNDADDGQQLATVYRATGAEARALAAAGDVLFEAAPVSVGASTDISESQGYRFYAGPRSDPFFADAEGLFNGYDFTGADSFGGQDVLAMAIELPGAALGSDTVAVWARTLVKAHDGFVQADRTGGSNVMNFLTYGSPDEIKPYREAGPDEDCARFSQRYISILKSVGYSTEEAAGAVADLLPDVLHYDRRRPAEFPNGRGLSDDLADLAVSLMTRGRVTSDGVGPHQDLQATFPYLGRPHRS